jgi:hypothetical protein
VTAQLGQRGQVMTVLDMRGSNPLSRSKIKKMTDKEALQEIVFMVNNYVNGEKYGLPNPHSNKFISNLVEFLEENVIHCAMDNNYK